MTGTVVICFTDIVDSTKLSTHLGDEVFDEVRRRHFEVLERQVDAHGGEVVKSLGDGLMTTFGSASDAVAAGVAMQRAVDAASRSGQHDAVVVRVGISAGDATSEDGDWFGAPVVEGARLCAAAAPGQILVSEVVRLLAGSRGGHEFRSVGTLELKGLPEPVGAAEVAWTPTAATVAVPLPGPLAPEDGELPFSGRDDDLDELRQQWKAAVAGERRVVMVAGEPGVGKTRLVAELARSVHTGGALVLLGRTQEHVDAPYGPWREALRALVRSAPDEMLERHAAEHGGELARIVPEIDRRVEGLARPIATDPETERLLLFEAVTGLTEFAAMLWRETEGNPFFVGEVLRHLIETGGLAREDGRWRASATLDQAGLPEGVREVIGRRLSGLSEATNTVLSVASVIGREFDVGFVAEVAEQPVGAVLEALEPAERARLIAAAPGRPGRYSFSHALVRTVLVEELGTNRRVRLHRAAGLALEAQTSPSLGELAHHFGEAAVMGESGRAVKYAAEAADQALTLAAPEEAVSFARRAIDAAELADVAMSTRAGLLLLLGRALGAAGSLDEARDVVADAFTSAVNDGDVEVACAAALEYGGVQAVWEMYGDERGPAQLRSMLDLLPDRDSELRAAVLIRLGEWLISAPGDIGAQAARDAYDMAARLKVDAVRRAATVRVIISLRNVDPRAQLTLVQEARALSHEVGTDLEAEAVADAQLAVGDLDSAYATIAEGHSAREAAGLHHLGYFRDTWLLTRALIDGRFSAVPALADALDGYDAVLPRSFAAIGRAELCYQQGDWKRAAAAWDAVCETAPAMMTPYPRYRYLTIGEDEFREQWDAWRSEIEPLLPTWARGASVSVMSECLRRRGDRDGSRELAAEFASHSGDYLTNGTCWFHGPWDRALGVLSATAGDLDNAVAYLTRAVEQSDAIASPTWGAIARLELATAARIRAAPGDATLAATSARDAGRLMEEVGMPGWIDRLTRLDAGDLEPWKPVAT